MPQIIPGQSGQQAQAPKLYGIGKVENTVPFHEKMLRLFKPQEFVTIKNIDDEDLYWQYMPIENEQESFSEDGMQRMVTREQPEMWMIPAGETEVIVGASAYRALDAMYKNCTAKSTLKRFADPTSPQFNEKNEHLPKNFNFADAGAQDEFLRRAYLGKAMPSFGPVASETTEAPQPLAAAPIKPMTAYALPNQEATSAPVR